MSEQDDDPFSLPGSEQRFDLQLARLKVAMLEKDVRTLRRDVDDYEERCKENSIKLDNLREAFATLKNDVKMPIRMVYGMATVILTSFIVAVASLVMKAH